MIKTIISNAVNKKNQIERIKELCLNKAYICNGDLYQLLSNKKIKKIVRKIKNGNIELSSDIVYGRNIISNEEKFLENLDRYIGYIRNHYFIDYIEQRMLIEMSLFNKYNNILLDTDDFHSEQNFKKYFNSFRKMFLYNFYENIKFYSMYVEENSTIHKFLKDIKKYNFDKENDIIEIEKIMIQVLNNRKNNLYNSFVPYNEIKRKHLDFYIHQVEWVLSDYYKNKAPIPFEITDNDNSIITTTNDEIVFNVISDINDLKDDDTVYIDFGMKNYNFSSKITNIDLKKYEFTKLLNELKNDDYSKKYDFEMTFIDPTLRFNFWCDGSNGYLDIMFEYAQNSNYIVIGLNKKEKKELYEMLIKQTEKNNLLEEKNSLVLTAND